ncbi:cation transporter [Microvirga ossetica]|uniref:Cation transporter n=1 Tax=Microvirga ossetica TaxID=1882682 RepID=A0A1B2EBQ8_9HYPH|nr:Na+/H+ antiporter subunit E [Microvirga ossetica]ANY77401.1 cation transporter [Microvirga ossetica]
MSDTDSDRDNTKPPFRSHGVVSLWAVLFVVWMVANSTLAVVVVLLGAAITLPIAWIFASSGGPWNRIRWTPDGLLHFSLYGATFLVELVKANITMMRYVYARRIDIKPGIVKVRTRLKSPIGRLALANTIALTPGSLVMELRGDTLFIHLLDIDGIDADATTDAIVTPFERHLEHVFG